MFLLPFPNRKVELNNNPFQPNNFAEIVSDLESSFFILIIVFTGLLNKRQVFFYVLQYFRYFSFHF